MRSYGENPKPEPEPKIRQYCTVYQMSVSLLANGVWNLALTPFHHDRKSGAGTVQSSTVQGLMMEEEDHETFHFRLLGLDLDFGSRVWHCLRLSVVVSL